MSWRIFWQTLELILALFGPIAIGIYGFYAHVAWIEITITAIGTVGFPLVMYLDYREKKRKRK